ncbi:Geranylgeranyl pyrophosphate synthase, chloroplastic [Capsicum chinense]|nr:Geranylgeranyl pyrophosphate synthase, chloroplastic [Capsicum chinense]
MRNKISTPYKMSLEEAIEYVAFDELIEICFIQPDNIPCMDNNDLRKGKLSHHEVFSENATDLTGYFLLALAFEHIRTLSCRIFIDCTKNIAEFVHLLLTYK